jgi:hypothetical protein
VSASFNSIYGLLVEDQNDFLGILAYSVYKRQKIEFIHVHLAKTGQPPSDADLAPFYALSRSETQLQHYRTQALALAEEFVTTAFGEHLETTRETLEQEYKVKLETLKPSFGESVFASVIGSFVFTLLLGLIVFFSWSLTQGPQQVIESIFKVRIVPTEKILRP